MYQARPCIDNVMQDAVLQWKRAIFLCLMLFSKISNFDLMVFKGSYSSISVAVAVVVYVSSRTLDVGDLYCHK